MDFLFADTKPSPSKLREKSESAAKKLKMDPSQAVANSGSSSKTSSKQRNSNKHDGKKRSDHPPPPKPKRPVISDSDTDSDDETDGNFLTRKRPLEDNYTNSHVEEKFQMEIETPVAVHPQSVTAPHTIQQSVKHDNKHGKSSSAGKYKSKASKKQTANASDTKSKPSSSAGQKRKHKESEDSFDDDGEGPLAMSLNDDHDTDDFKSKKVKSKDTPKTSSAAKANKKENKKLKAVKKEEVRTPPTKAKITSPKAITPKKEIKPQTSESPKKKKKKEEEQVVRKWWEEERLPEGIKWKTLGHKGPYFPPPYEPLPKHVKFYYDGKPIDLSPESEEVAGFFAKMLDHDYTSRDIFIQNFWADWRKSMTSTEAKTIKDFKKCDFTEMHKYFKEKSEERKQMTKEQKAKIKEENEKIVEEYGYAEMDGHKEKIGNFKIEPPGLFRGRGDHPKQGMIKRRIQPEDVTINIGKGVKVPTPPEGHKWKEIINNNTVTWLASWTENVQGAIKYVMLNPTSRIKAEKDLMKYETARKLKKFVVDIRRQYTDDLKSQEMRIRQRATALYFIDKLALRAGNEKDTDETADTVGCCSLRVEHITLHEELDGEEKVVEFDFLGKDSIRYQNKVPVDKQVFKNLKLFVKGKEGADNLFDRLSTSDLNKHLQDLMEGLTAKVFRTYNASNTLQEQLDLLTDESDSVVGKTLSYNRANRAVAVLCNHQRAPPKTFSQQMENLQKKIDAKKEAVRDVEKELKGLKKEAKSDSRLSKKVDSTKKKLERLREQEMKLEVAATDKEENKEIALGTSKLNYLDPRISVAWCKKWDIPVEKIYNKSQRQKFAWAIHMTEEDFEF